jgi:hypothetical protein
MHDGRSAENIYYFKDQHNVPHLTNVPSDPRYRLLFSTTPLSATAPAEAAHFVQDTHPEKPDDESGPVEIHEPDEVNDSDSKQSNAEAAAGGSKKDDPGTGTNTQPTGKPSTSKSP